MHSMVLFVCCFPRTKMENKHNTFVHVNTNPYASGSKHVFDDVGW